MQTARRRLDVAVNRVVLDGSPAQAARAASRMRSMMRTRAFSSSSDDDDSPEQGAQRPGGSVRSGTQSDLPAATSESPSGSLGVEARRLMGPGEGEKGQEARLTPESQRKEPPPVAACVAHEEAERGALQEAHTQRDELARALELALAESEQLKRERDDLKRRVIEEEREMKKEGAKSVADDAPTRTELGSPSGPPARTPQSTHGDDANMVEGIPQVAEPPREQCWGGMWAMATDASGAAYYYPVVLIACGDPVWEMPQDGIILSSNHAQQIRSEAEFSAQTERAHALFGKVLLFAILVQSTMAVAFVAYMQYHHDFISNLSSFLFVSADTSAASATGPEGLFVSAETPAAASALLGPEEL